MGFSRFAKIAAVGLTIGLLTARGAMADACTSVLCMGGLVEGRSGGPGCVAPINMYFSIQVWDEEGFDAAATAAARQSYLEQCPFDQGWIYAIQEEFGTQP